jgi:N-succinyl-L-ornithine transcarbamylase
MNQFLSLEDVEDLWILIEKVKELKKNPYSFQKMGENKTIGLVFFNPSLRTRLSSQKAAFNLGANIWILNADNDSWKIEMNDGTVMEKSQEHIKEAISVMSLYCDILALRTFPKFLDRYYDSHELFFKKIKNYSRVPVISLESATLHPLQSLADVFTIEEFRPPEKKRIKVVLSWAPHLRVLPHSVPNSFLQWVSELSEVDLVITHPPDYELDKRFSQMAKRTYDQKEAFEGADFIYAKNWSSYLSYGKILYQDPWRITKEKMSLTDNGKFMHCLPVRRGIVVEDSVLDGKNSLVFQQAENRILAAQTVFMEILKKILSDSFNQNRRKYYR